MVFIGYSFLWPDSFCRCSWHTVYAVFILSSIKKSFKKPFSIVEKIKIRYFILNSEWYSWHFNSKNHLMIGGNLNSKSSWACRSGIEHSSNISSASGQGCNTARHTLFCTCRPAAGKGRASAGTTRQALGCVSSFFVQKLRRKLNRQQICGVQGYFLKFIRLEKQLLKQVNRLQSRCRTSPWWLMTAVLMGLFQWSPGWGRAYNEILPATFLSYLPTHFKGLVCLKITTLCIKGVDILFICPQFWSLLFWMPGCAMHNLLVLNLICFSSPRVRFRVQFNHH